MNVAVNQFTHAVDLSGQWQLAETDGSHATKMKVPGDVHSALITAGIIPHPYTGTNELACRWVADEKWVATKSFVLERIEDGEYHLDIDYLDTVADVSVGGYKVVTPPLSERDMGADATMVRESVR